MPTGFPGGPQAVTNRLRRLARRPGWPGIIWAVERLKGEGWGEFCDRHGDWGRDAALWLGRRAGRLSLAGLGRLAGGMGYAAAAQALTRDRMDTDRIRQDEHD